MPFLSLFYFIFIIFLFYIDILYLFLLYFFTTYDIFLNRNMEKFRLPEQKTLPKTAWNKLKKLIKECLEYSDEEEID